MSSAPAAAALPQTKADNGLRKWMIVAAASFSGAVVAQRPPDAPKTAASGKPPDTVYLEEAIF